MYKPNNNEQAKNYNLYNRISSHHLGWFNKKIKTVYIDDRVKLNMD